MGWTGYEASYFKPNGDIDRKAEIKAHYEKNFEILKDSLVGSTYYGAFRERTDDRVFAVVIHTSVRNGYFYYKTITEDEGPNSFDCPKSIFKLLSPARCEWSREWREKCEAKRESKNTLKNLPVGSVIKINVFNGTRILTKRAPAYQFKTCWWETDRGTYYSKKYIPNNYEILSKGGN